jgi:hypothetical protein
MPEIFLLACGERNGEHMTTDRYVATASTRRRAASAGLVGMAAAVAVSPLAQPAAASPAATGHATGLDSDAASSLPTARPDVTPSYGYEKIRIGVQIKSGAYVPPGTTTVGSQLDYVESGPSRTVTGVCTTDASTVAAGSTASYCVFANGDSDTNYSAEPGDTVTIKQVKATDGLVLSKQSKDIPPCVVPTNEFQCPGDTDATLTDRGIAPTAGADHTTVVDGLKVRVNVLGNDHTAGAPPTLKVPAPPTHGRTKVVGSGTTARIRYTPKPGFSGRDHFAYQLHTANGVATALVTITVTAGQPKAKNDHANDPAGQPINIHVLANDQGYGGGAPGVSRVGKAKHGTVKRHKHYVVYRPDPGYTGEDHFTYTIRTRAGTSTATVTVTVR